MFLPPRCPLLGCQSCRSREVPSFRHMPNPRGRLVTATQSSHRGYLAESSHAKRWSCLCNEAWFSLFLLAPALAASSKNLTLNDLRVRAHPVLSASITRAHPVAGNMSAPIPQTIIAFIYIYLISWELSQCVHVYSWGRGPGFQGLINADSAKKI